MAAQAAGSASKPSSTPWLVVRIFVLAALWVAVNWWATTHFGRSLTDIGTVNAVLAAFLAILALLPEAQKSHAEAEKTRLVQRLVLRLLSPWVLASLVVAFLLLGSFVSSVHVDRVGVGGDRRVEIYFDGKLLTGDDLKGEQDYFRQTVRTSYAGRTLVLQVSGFSAQSLEVEPWRPAVVGLDDLPASPGVLLVDLDKVTMPAGTLRFFCPEDIADGSAPDDFPTAGVDGPVALGAAGDPDQETLATWTETLRSRLRAQQIGDQDIRDVVELARRTWSKAAAGPELPCLEPGLNLRTVLCTPLGKAVATAGFQVEARSIAVELARSDLPADADAWCASLTSETEPSHEDSP